MNSPHDPLPDPSSDPIRSRDALTALILAVFRLNGELLIAGDALVGDLGLTSARWQVLGAVALSPVPLPVSHLARNMGLSRQAVQRVVDDMRGDGLVSLKPNPHHRRAMLVIMTEPGRSTFAAATERQRRWATQMSSKLRAENIEAATALMRALLERLEAAEAPPATAIAVEA